MVLSQKCRSPPNQTFQLTNSKLASPAKLSLETYFKLFLAERNIWIFAYFAKAENQITDAELLFFFLYYVSVLFKHTWKIIFFLNKLKLAGASTALVTVTIVWVVSPGCSQRPQ